MSTRKGWLEVAEKGSITGIWAIVVLSTLAGRRPTRAFLRALVAYYLLTHRSARETSRNYLQRLHGGPVGLGAVYDHLLRFAQCTADRLYFVRGKVGQFDMVSIGEEHLLDLQESKRGAILLGAHLGSFEAMQRLADVRGIRVNIVGYFRHAAKINAVLERLNPTAQAKLIEADPESFDFVLQIRERIEAGELVSILGDRIGHDESRSVQVDFGAPARFPTGPFILAAALRCPVYLIYSLQRGGADRYELHCEPFAEEVRLPRKGRDEALRKLAQRYAERLEHYCRLAPNNWFNFYDFWADPEKGATLFEGGAP